VLEEQRIMREEVARLRGELARRDSAQSPRGKGPSGK
jgi:hypothetical protein